MSPKLLGYAAEGSGAGDAIAPLLDAFGLRWRLDAEGIALVERTATGRTLARTSEIRALDGREEPPARQQRAPIEDVPVRLSVRHFDPDRDYQLGVQSAQRPGPGQPNRRDRPAGSDRRRHGARDRRPVVAHGAGGAADDRARLRLAGARSQGRETLSPLRGRRGPGSSSGWNGRDMTPRLSLRAARSGALVLPASGDSGQPVLPPIWCRARRSWRWWRCRRPDDRLAEMPLVYAGRRPGSTAGWRRQRCCAIGPRRARPKRWTHGAARGSRKCRRRAGTGATLAIRRGECIGGAARRRG